MVLETFIGWRRLKQTPQASDPFEPTPVHNLLLQAPVKLLLFHTYHLLNSLRSAPTPAEPPIRVVCISDTHDQFPDDVPAGDILIHAGDLTNDGSVASIQKQVDWLCSLPHKEIVVISGNHDTYLDPRTRPSLSDDQRAGSIDWKRIHYLQHRTLTLTLIIEPSNDAVEGPRTHLLSSRSRRRKIKLFGAPQIPACGPMSVHAFQYPRGMDAWSETVPEDTDILITHTPPKYHLDLSLPGGMGCEHLAKEVKRVKPTLHIFGHVHWGAGKMVVWWDGCHDAYESGMGTKSRPIRGLLNPWLWFNIIRVGYRGMRNLVWDKVWGGPRLEYDHGECGANSWEYGKIGQYHPGCGHLIYVLTT